MERLPEMQAFPAVSRRLRSINARLHSLAPGPWAWNGAAAGIVLSGTAAVWVLLGDSIIGFGSRKDFAISIGACTAGVCLCALTAIGVTKLVRCVPPRVVGSVAGVVAAFLLFQAVLGGVEPRVWIVLAIVPLEGLFGLALGALVGGEIFRGTLTKRIGGASLLAVTVAGNVALIIWLRGPGTDAQVALAVGDAKPGKPLSAANPGARGTYHVLSLIYGSGEDARRPEFGADVKLKTPPVDASLLLPDLKGFRKSARTWFWGFDPSRFPLNGRACYPEGAGPFPLVLFVHGNHTMEEFSDAGYEYLCEHLASRGFIAVAIDENFLNSTWSGDLQGTEMPARAWMILQHLRQWRTWNSAANSPFFKKVDLDQIALVGHSRGGEAVADATVLNRLSRYPENALLQFEFGFSIRGVAALAPIHGWYKPGGERAHLPNVDYLVIQGAHDADVATFAGTQAYQDVKFAGAAPHFKCALFVSRANHGQFNTVWDVRDWSGPLHALQNIKPLMSGTDQRQVATVFLSAFLEASLRGHREYLPMFRDPNTAAGWLPKGNYMARYEDSAFVPVSNFEEDVDVTTATLAGATQEAHGMKVWREEKIPLRAGDDQGNRAVLLKWEKGNESKSHELPQYQIKLSADAVRQLALRADTTLRLTLAGAEESPEPLRVTIRLEAGNTRAELPVGPGGGIEPPIRAQISKLPWIEGLLIKPFEIVLQTREIPLAEFLRAQPGFDQSALRAITILFDDRRAGAAYVDDIGFSTPWPR